MIPFFEISNERMFRNMGYFGDQSGIEKRYLREQQHWDKHLYNTRQYALESAKGKNRQSAVVLGSGWLLDVPVEELSKLFEKVTLIDIRHPKAVKKRIQVMENVELQVCDISGFAATTYQYMKLYRNKKNRPPVDSIQAQPSLNLDAYDFVFSCNILSQLDILLMEYLERFFTLTDEEMLAFRKKIQHHHISLLPRNRSCIVVDYEEITYSHTGEEISRRPLVFHEITKNPNTKEWIWEFDTHMTYYEGKKTYFKVMGIKI